MLHALSSVGVLLDMTAFAYTDTILRGSWDLAGKVISSLIGVLRNDNYCCLAYNRYEFPWSSKYTLKPLLWNPYRSLQGALQVKLVPKPHEPPSTRYIRCWVQTAAFSHARGLGWQKAVLQISVPLWSPKMVRHCLANFTKVLIESFLLSVLAIFFEGSHPTTT